MAADGTVTHWLGPLKAGDPEAARRLWDVYVPRLVALARDRLRGRPIGVADEEDVALSAFDSFCRGAARGRFARLDHRDDLWQLLVVITVRKAISLARGERRAVRGGGRVQSLSDLDGPEAEAILGHEPGPELATQVAEECRRLLGLLRDDTLRSIALWKMEGYTNAEIAEKLGCVRFTVDRKLRAIRRAWSSAEEGA
jgi:DNA-directed RNA polymerase specialized sigma24 family protein